MQIVVASIATTIHYTFVGKRFSVSEPGNSAADTVTQPGSVRALQCPRHDESALEGRRAKSTGGRMQ
jgi:hypothetical protein